MEEILYGVMTRSGKKSTYELGESHLDAIEKVRKYRSSGVRANLYAQQGQRIAILKMPPQTQIENTNKDFKAKLERIARSLLEKSLA